MTDDDNEKPTAWQSVCGCICWCTFFLFCFAYCVRSELAQVLK